MRAVCIIEADAFSDQLVQIRSWNRNIFSLASPFAMINSNITWADVVCKNQHDVGKRVC
jgi:hypothetical protein